MFDVICVGGGVAGATTAGVLARGGRRVLVLERSCVPRDKACGEGILPHGVHVLDRLGVPLPRATLTRGIHFRIGGESLVLDFPEGHGVAVRRFYLDDALRRFAIEAGAEVRQATVRQVDVFKEVAERQPGTSRAATLLEGRASSGCPPARDSSRPVGREKADPAGRSGPGPTMGGRVSTDQGIFEGNLLVGADGIHSVFHRDLGLRRRDPAGGAGSRRIGFSTHLTGFRASPDLVEVVCFDGGEVYIAPVPGGLTLVALLVEERLGLRASDVFAFVSQLLPDRAVGTRLATPVLGSSPLAYSVDRIAGENWMLVGDSAGRIDPITGEGLSVALTSGVMAAEAAERALSGEGSLLEYETRVRAFRRPLEQVTSLLLYMSRHPRLARPFLRLGSGRLSVLMRVATGMEGFSWPGLVGSVLAPKGKPRSSLPG